MRRLLYSCLVGLLAFPSAGLAQTLDGGMLHQSTPGIGESDWLIIPNGDGTFKAEEYGLGNARGTARLKDRSLVIEWTTGEYAGVYEWKAVGLAGVYSM